MSKIDVDQTVRELEAGKTPEWITDKEREQLWEQMVQVFPPYREYQKKTKREIPIVVLEKQLPSK